METVRAVLILPGLSDKYAFCFLDSGNCILETSATAMACGVREKSAIAATLLYFLVPSTLLLALDDEVSGSPVFIFADPDMTRTANSFTDFNDSSDEGGLGSTRFRV